MIARVCKPLGNERVMGSGTAEPWHWFCVGVKVFLATNVRCDDIATLLCVTVRVHDLYRVIANTMAADLISSLRDSVVMLGTTTRGLHALAIKYHGSAVEIQTRPLKSNVAVETKHGR